MSLQYFQKQVRDENIFLHADKQIFHKFFFKTFNVKVSYKLKVSLLIGIIKHSQSTSINKFAISLHNLKKEVREGVHFWHLVNIKVSTSWYYFEGGGQACQSCEIRNLVIFLQYLQKKVSQLVLCSIAMQNIQIFEKDPTMFLFCY